MSDKKQEEWGVNQLDISDCIFCQRKGTVYTNGSYCDGYMSFVQCDDYYCGASGPKFFTKPRSNDNEYENENKAIAAWNKVMGIKK